ncbi:hypothetical protein TSOC_004385 [Tetrabaena socialis]|uniref:Uncharacterized protein n=1 Tax=Tetrabaena socialis TaxID=47790 RepID=A0A2J8A945_9CHLO|nr:hypothetical protein TSOC_004385 [Tetrabaena socialis]|eukprot:PNH09039.1 hypothetical protein TSOC_004385 [Tetrabaena socialis]
MSFACRTTSVLGTQSIPSRSLLVVPAVSSRTGVRTAVSSRADPEQEVSTSSRRGLVLGGLLLSLAATADLVSPGSAAAWGTGFPGYDMDLNGRKRAMDRNKREMQAEVERAAAFRAAKKKAAEEASK